MSLCVALKWALTFQHDDPGNREIKGVRRRNFQVRVSHFQPENALLCSLCVCVCVACPLILISGTEGKQELGKAKSWTKGRDSEDGVHIATKVQIIASDAVS